MKLKLLSCLFLAAILSGCASVEMVDDTNDDGAAVVGLDYRDFEKAGSQMVQDMLASGTLNHPKGGRYVLMVAVTNDTMQRIDTMQLTKSITDELRNSGKVALTTAVGSTKDQSTYDVRDGLRDNEEFDQARVQKKGTLVAPDLSLYGKILQKNVKMGGGKQQIEYYFMLSLNDLSTGLETWGKQTRIIKRASNASAAW